MANRILDDKPVAALRTFARKLGWPSLRSCQHTIEACDTYPDGLLLTWYESGLAKGLRSDLFLHMNESPIGQTSSYEVAVFAIRFRLFSGWHAMRLADGQLHDDAEVERLDPWVHRRWFHTLPSRRQFREMHPECVGYSWKRFRDRGFRPLK